MIAIEAVTTTGATAALCQSVGLARATLYRRRQPAWSSTPTPRAASARALGPAERQAVFDVLHSEGVVARIVTGPHDTHRRDPHLPMRYDTGRPRAAIRLRISQPRTTSLPCPAGLRARRPSPMMDL